MRGSDIGDVLAIRLGMRAKLLGCVLAVAACHVAKHEPGVDAGIDLGSGGGANGGPCNVVITHETPLAAASHVPQGTVVEWASNPPSSGAHYPTHAAWALTYPIIVERGNYLHNEEHGGIALLYNCADAGCQDTIDNLTAIGQALPQDPACVSVGVNAKWLVTRDPELPAGTSVAAAAWGWTFTATCVDDARLNAFITARYSNGGPDRTNCGGALTP
jgi:hypothetical protein